MTCFNIVYACFVVLEGDKFMLLWQRLNLMEKNRYQNNFPYLPLELLGLNLSTFTSDLSNPWYTGSNSIKFTNVSGTVHTLHKSILVPL